MRASKRGFNWNHMAPFSAFKDGDVPFVTPVMGDCGAVSGGRTCRLPKGHTKKDGTPSAHAMPFMRGNALRRDSWWDDPQVVVEPEATEPEIALVTEPPQDGEAEKPKRKKKKKKKADSTPDGE